MAAEEIANLSAGMGLGVGARCYKGYLHGSLMAFPCPFAIPGAGERGRSRRARFLAQTQAVPIAIEQGFPFLVRAQP